MNQEIIPPSRADNVFTCPHCQCITRHTHSKEGRNIIISSRVSGGKAFEIGKNLGFPKETGFSEIIPIGQMFSISVCDNCEKICIWLDGKLEFPANFTLLPQAIVSMPDNIKSVYEKASKVFDICPMASALLLRKVLEMLCNELGYAHSRTLYDKLEHLKKEQVISNDLIESAQLIRILGNIAAHANDSDIDIDPRDISLLFDLTIFLADRVVQKLKITDAKERVEKYERNP